MSKKDNSGWDAEVCDKLIDQLSTVRTAMLSSEHTSRELLKSVDRGYAASARNFTHYLSLRRFDLRSLQEKLAQAGVSSLGRSESHVLANLDKVLGILHRLAGRPWVSHSDDEPIGLKDSKILLDRHTEELLGAVPPGRAVRIMVTLPSEAADDFGLVKRLMQAGMDVARINCAHDGPNEWRAMAGLVRRAAKSVNRPVRVLMDLAGPKLRTAEVARETAVLKVRPVRDEFGQVLEPARLWLRNSSESSQPMDVDCQISVDHDWLEKLRMGDKIKFKDARGARRRFIVTEHGPSGVLVESVRTAYIVPETEFVRPHHDGDKRRCHPVNVPRLPAEFYVNRGDTVRLTRDSTTVQAMPYRAKKGKVTFEIGCTLPEVFTQVRKGERVWFDDGRIGGFVHAAAKDWIEVEITDAREGGEKLAGDKGINLPDSQLDLPALTQKDLADLAVVAEIADIVGLSFVQNAKDVVTLRSRMDELGASDLGVVLKVETRSGFDHLPELMFAAMANRAAGVMIARGDLAVECGYERLAEVQEEILWACEAAHMPVIWATQVLETLAKTGRPSRAEVSDAAMGERSECVMLNKGPFIVDAMRTLDDILKRMQAHQSKKRPLLRALRAWNPPAS
jgi:pyruvate kinase